MLAGSFIIMEIFNVHPGILVGFMLVASFVFPDKKVQKLEIQVKGKSESV
jgi:chromate transporter